jgi:hypothetical protein
MTTSATSWETTRVRACSATASANRRSNAPMTSWRSAYMQRYHRSSSAAICPVSRSSIAAIAARTPWMSARVADS